MTTMRALSAFTTAELDAMDAMEAGLQEKWPTRGIVTGSILAPDCEDNPFPGKFSVEITCVDCGAIRRIATQDLFQVERCKECAKKHQRRNRSKNRLAKKSSPVALAARRARLEAELASLDAVSSRETEEMEDMEADAALGAGVSAE